MAGDDDSLSLSLFLAHLPIVIHFVVDTDNIYIYIYISCSKLSEKIRTYVLAVLNLLGHSV